MLRTVERFIGLNRKKICVNPRHLLLKIYPQRNHKSKVSAIIINIHGGNNLILPNAVQLPSSFQDVHSTPLIERSTDESGTTIIYNIYDGQHIIAPNAQQIATRNL